MKIKVSDMGSHSQANLSGNVDESCGNLFQEIFAQTSNKPVVVDCKDVVHINSIGVARWSSSLEQISSSVEVRFANCPMGMINYGALIKGFFGRHQIESFFISYQCSHCDGFENVNYRTLDTMKGGSFDLSLQQKTCVKCGKSTEAATDIDDYQNLLNRNAPKPKVGA